MGMSNTRERLLSIARPELRSLSIGLIFLIISSVSGLAFPQVVRWMMDNVLQAQRPDLLLPVVGLLFLAFALQGVTGALRYYFFTISGERIVIRLRQKLFEKILSQDVEFFDFQRTGDLMSRLASDCTTLQNTVSVNVSQGLRNLGQALGGLGFMFYTSWRLSLLMLLLIPPIALSAAIFGRKIRAFAKEFQESLAQASVVAEETISNVRTVKSFVQELFEVRRYQNSMVEALVWARKRIVAIGIFMGVAMVVGLAAVCFVLWYGGTLVFEKQLSLGDLTQFLLYLMLVAIAIGSLGSLWGDFMAGLGATKRVFEILDHQARIISPTAPVTPSTLQGRLEIKNLSFSYPSRPEFPVIKNIQFIMDPGKVIALAGSSGSGKSTIAQLLTRFYDPNAGEILLDGQGIKKLDPAWLRQQIGIVSQEPVLISSTIAENIRYGKPEASFEEVRKAARDANALEFIESFPQGFETRVGERGIQLSGGQKQRVAIARALLKDPKILILDEATSNLDSASEKLVQEALKHLVKGRTTLIIAHRLSTIIDADCILVMDHGEIKQRGKHQELMSDKNGLYFQLLQKQFIDKENIHASALT